MENPAEVQRAPPAEVDEADEELDIEEEPELDDDGGAGAGPGAGLSPPRVLGPSDPGRMEISAEERQRALNIRSAIANAAEINPVSDFMCAQLALIDGDNIIKALERVLHLQYFREEYGILDTAEDGRRHLMRLVDLFPGLLLSFTFNYDQGNYVILYDVPRLDTRLLNSEDRIRTWLGGCFYKLAILCPDLEAVRRGAIMISECEGYDWKINLEMKGLRRVWSEVALVYPMRWEKFKYFHAGNAFILVVSMVRKMFPQRMRNMFELGCTCDRRLDELYMIPDVATANQRLLGRIDESIRRRYENEETFRL